ncbi:cell division control protein (nucleomorph) [Bigelowiella natans]|uniref:Cell division control protein n=1 Tax=Bigelowiella natans TaxID=227086 RepID=Q3LVV9_BIGNA|nr:cell division control protein [Bigelowiella natans]ABA27406.1 cell division control protein [Bigelowiella natans]
MLGSWIMTRNTISHQQIAQDLSNKKYSNINDQKILLNEKNYSIYINYKRYEFEQILMRKGSFTKKIWIEYFKWEENNGNLVRARDILERMCKQFNLDEESYLKYISFEIKNWNIQGARNIFERGLKILSNSQVIWEKYIDFENSLENYKKTRNIFKRWLSNTSSINIWVKYLDYEVKQGDYQKARSIITHILEQNPNYFILEKVQNFEINHGSLTTIRNLMYLMFNKPNFIHHKAITILKFANCEYYSYNILRSKVILNYLNHIYFKVKKNKISYYIKYFSNQEHKLLIESRKKFQDKISKSVKNHLFFFHLLDLEYCQGTIESFLALYEKAMENVPLLKYSRSILSYQLLIEYYFLLLSSLNLTNLLKVTFNRLMSLLNTFKSELEEIKKINEYMQFLKLNNEIFSINLYDTTMNTVNSVYYYCEKYFVMIQIKKITTLLCTLQNFNPYFCRCFEILNSIKLINSDEKLIIKLIRIKKASIYEKFLLFHKLLEIFALSKNHLEYFQILQNKILDYFQSSFIKKQRYKKLFMLYLLSYINSCSNSLFETVSLNTHIKYEKILKNISSNYFD